MEILEETVTLSEKRQYLTTRRRRDLANDLFIWALRSIALGAIALVLAVILIIIVKGAPAISIEFLTSPPTEGMTSGGIYPMIRGSVLLLTGTFLIALPLGILGGIFLAEYAGRGLFGKLMHACIASLAGTPSVIYGLFGLAVFVLMMKLGVSLLAGCLTLALFALPPIIFTTENAIRSVPETFIEAGYALGLSRSQVLLKIVLPHALPGILTGIILSSGRAAGETPPILLTAGIYYATGELAKGWEVLKQPVANLPYHLAEGYRQGGVIPEEIVWGTCLVLTTFVLSINVGSVIVRLRTRRKQRW
jgi:phosphate transport system permease protein